MNKKTTLFQSFTFLSGILMMFGAVSLASPSKAMSVDEIRQIIAEEAMETSVPTSLVLAVVKTESNFRPDHEGRDGARGLMQILPVTAESLGLVPSDLWQVRPNVRAGLSILEDALDRTDGRWEEAVQAYGSNRRKLKSVKNQRYVTAVLKSERQYAEQLAAVDALSDRRREVLAGHDNWGSAHESDDEVAGFDLEDTDFPEDDQIFEPEARHDDWAQEEEEIPEVTIVRGNGGRSVEVIIVEKTEWHRPPPRPVYRRKLRPRPPGFRAPIFTNRSFFSGPRNTRQYGFMKRHYRRHRK